MPEIMKEQVRVLAGIERQLKKIAEAIEEEAKYTKIMNDALYNRTFPNPPWMATLEFNELTTQTKEEKNNG